MDFAALPPEINSGRMYAGAGSGPLLAAAATWNGLAADLSSTANSYGSVVSGLANGPWLGPASASMAAAAAPYVAWLSTTAEQAKQTAGQARAAAAAYEAAFAATVPPPVIAENRARLMVLVATNILGQNTPAIAATEAQYAEMWAQDATAMYGYAGASAVASRVTPFTQAPQNTDPAGVGGQAAAVEQAAGTSAAGHSTALSQLISAVPNVLQGLASGGSVSGGAANSSTGLGSVLSSLLGTGSLGPSLGNIADYLNFGSGTTFVGSGILFILGPLLEGPIIGATQHLGGALGGVGAAGLGGAGAAGLGSAGAAGLGGAGLSASLGTAGVPAGLGGAGLSASLGRAASVGGLSVPPSWGGAVPATTRVATALPEPTLAAFSETGFEGMGPGGMLPAGLMTAAAGGGGAAGGSWAAQRGAGGAPRGGGASRYGSRPTVLPQVAHEAGAPPGRPDHGAPRDPGGLDGEGALSANVRDEINDLRKQIAQLAMERDLLMRTAALWAKEAGGR